MWIKVSDKTPMGQKLYNVFGLCNKGSQYEGYHKFIAKWNGDENGWTDEDGDDFNGINDGITHWFDFSLVKPPIE